MKLLPYEIVKIEIDKWDPMGLLSGGAPDDEYDPEIKNIVNELKSVNTEQELAILTKNVFEKWFGEEFSFESCLTIAKNIWGQFQK
ncbi:DUF1871 family protein [Gottfriedia sp. NPDC058432]|uniref:DUF1871 family protein n=1 Tax=Gottfriedia sp. NPDC058432 TaxID=3346497 RepID=UPI003666527D